MTPATNEMWMRVKVLKNDFGVIQGILSCIIFFENSHFLYF